MSGFGYEFVSVCEGCLCRLDIADFIIVLLAVSVPIVTLKIDMKYPKEKTANRVNYGVTLLPIQDGQRRRSSFKFTDVSGTYFLGEGFERFSKQKP